MPILLSVLPDDRFLIRLQRELRLLDEVQLDLLIRAAQDELDGRRGFAPSRLPAPDRDLFSQPPF